MNKVCICVAVCALNAFVPVFTQAAEGDPFSAFVALGRTADSNVLRLSNDVSAAPLVGTESRSDNIARYMLGVELDTQYRLQRFKADASWNRQDYQRFNFLDHTDRSASGNWLWQFGSRLNGDAGLRYQRLLTSLADFGTPVAEMRTEKTGSFSANYSVHPDWGLTLGYEDISVIRGLPVLRIYNHDDRRTSLGLRYFGNPGNSVGVKLIYGKVDFPNQESVAAGSIDNSYRVGSVRATVDWAPTGATSLNGSLGYERVRHLELTGRDYNGLAGRLTHVWRIDGKTRVTTSLWREVTANSSISNYVLTRGASIAPTWAFSPKLSADLKLSQELRDYLGGTTLSLASRHDTIRETNAGINYGVLQNAVISISYDLGSRDSNSTRVDYHYHAWTAEFRLSL